MNFSGLGLPWYIWNQVANLLTRINDELT